MKKLNVKDLPVAGNVCAQVLREVERWSTWSMAHVIMNPMAESLPHNHQQMVEIYVITKGYGELVMDVGPTTAYCKVTGGNAYGIPMGLTHMLRNRSSGHLEHLVFALPPFDPSDILLVKKEDFAQRIFNLDIFLPEVQECFDGAKILPYSFPALDLSITFGWVINNPARHKQPHYHKEITEFIYVVEGEGFIEMDFVRRSIQPGDWIRIDPEIEHALRNESPEDMVVVCVCSPAFKMDDVHYHV
ncbi:MAG: cupin domain-containing protein [Candidatus Kaiserbacteria bacterium]|nr:cupin domain-containing protein [Candidatus Kaiserbacteria bacterium]